MSQKQKILGYIQSHGSITNADAAREFRCYRLSARIYDLIQDGVPIVCDMESVKNSDGSNERYGRYRIAS